MSRWTRMLMLGCTVASVGACSPSGRNNSGDGGTGADATGSGSGSGSGTDAPAIDDSRVYAHSGTVLYKVDTTNLTTSQIGPMSPLAMTGSGANVDKVNDIAIDGNHHMVGIGTHTLYNLDADTGQVISSVTLDATAQNFASLSYIPAPGGDILISADKNGDVWQIDTTAGSATKIGNYGKIGGQQLVSSGDIVGIQGLGVFATVDLGTTGGSTAKDYLVKLDPNNGFAAVALPANDTGYNKIFGLAFWKGKLYGFVDGGTDMGKIIEIDPATGVGTNPKDNAIEWYGAGVETTAPIIM